MQFIHTDTENRTDLLQWGQRGGGGIGWGIRISRCKLLHIEWMILHRTGSYVQYTVIHHNGKYFLKECICI